MSEERRLSTRLLHSDEGYRDDHIGPYISVSTNFRYPPPEGDKYVNPEDEIDVFSPSRHIYSRYTQVNSTRVEKVLGDLHNGCALTYSSGLAATFAALVHLNPKRIAIRDGYFGVHNTIRVYRKINPAVEIIDLDDEYREGDIVWFESPLNPTGEVRNIEKYANKIHAVGGRLGIDATFAPPPLQYPFKWGADLILHSATKYFGGHSDILAGVLVVKTEDEWRELWHDRNYLGSNIGSMESWLLLRSLRTFSLRIVNQSKTATILAQWLNTLAATPEGQEYEGVSGGLIAKVWHGSLQDIDDDGFDPAKQNEGGWSPCFSILLNNEIHARFLPAKLKLFTHATSLGGVESLIEQRIMSNPKEDPHLLRISVGIEDIEDLKADFREAFKSLIEPKA